MISNRLRSLTKYIGGDDKLIDVGCDHALLDIYLIKNNILKKILVSDVNEKALEQGIKNINKYGLNKQIETSLSNGIEKINKNINTAVISGMGTKTIVNILSHSNLKYLNKLIIQSNNDYDELRRTIVKKGFYIENEEIIQERGKYYINILFLRGHKKYSKKEFKYGIIFMDSSNKSYYEYLLQEEKKILKKIPKSKILLRFKHQITINELKNIIKNQTKKVKHEK